MSRLQILKQRAARGLVGITKLKDGWWIGTGKGMGACDGPFVSKREAIQKAYQWSFPTKRLRMYFNGEFVGYV